MSCYWLLSPLFGFCIFFISQLRFKKRLPFPPGPKGLPVLKNILDIPLSYEHLIYAQWGKQYGDVVHVSALGKHIIILNSVRAANDLLDQKSAIYSDRPYLPMIHDPELMNTEWAFSAKRYSKDWKRHRRLFTEHINPTTVTELFSGVQKLAVSRLMNSFLNNRAVNLRKVCIGTSASIILGVAYGLDIKSPDDKFVVLAQTAMDLTTEGFKPKYFVNLFPTLKHIPSWFPGNKFKSLSKRAAKNNYCLKEEPFEEAVKQMTTGNFTHSLVQTAMAETTEKNDIISINDIKEVAAQMYSAGADTMAAALHSLVLQLILNPTLQRRAQTELNAIVGWPDSPLFRLPTFTDRPALPFIDALIQEILRFMPPPATGVPHAVLEDDEYRGWRIPKGAIIIANSWGMNRDESLYIEPSKFYPDRFLDNDSGPPEPDPVATFGFGRRVCPGRFLAETTLWLEVACLLAVFTFSPGKDANGNDIDVRYAEEPLPGFIIHPQKFDYFVTPRSERAVKLIRETMSHSL